MLFVNERCLSSIVVAALFLINAVVVHVDGFGIAVRSSRSGRPSTFVSMSDWSSSNGPSTSASGGGAGGIEQIEFKIYPDGRVEETVRGVKGNNCAKVTESINEKLGKVVATQPTEEMFEQEVKIDETLYNTESSNGGDWSSGSSSW